MVDPRIYRAGIGLVAIAVIVFAFSLQSQPGGASTTLVPGSYFSAAAASARTLGREYPDRDPGGVEDKLLAEHVAGVLASLHGFKVTTTWRVSQTVAGSRRLATVTALRPGVSPGMIVIVSHRDGGGIADMSGTAVLLDLARALSGATLQRSVMLVSTSGQVGAAGASLLAASLAEQPVDAVLALGELGGAEVSHPVVAPWSDGDAAAPPMLRNTVSALVFQQAGLRSGGYGIGGQIAHLAFPFTLTEQGPFNSRGIPAVLLSLSGDRPTPARAALGPAGRVAGLGNAVLQTVNALDSGPPVPPPSPYLLISGKLVPEWAVRLLVLALILPVVAVTIDAVARVRRRGHSTLLWIGWVLAGAVPFLVGLLAVMLARLAGLLSAWPPGAVGAGGVPVTGGDAAVVAIVLALVVAAGIWLRPALLRLLARGASGGRRPETPAADGAAVALSVVMCALALAMWAANPFAAALIVPALHLWLWLAHPEVRSRRFTVLAVTLVGFAPALLVAGYYMHAYGLSPVGLVWSLTLMVAGGQFAFAGVCWSVALGCFASALVIALRAARAGGAASEPLVTVRGPLSYAGPGSLGGTKSALRR